MSEDYAGVHTCHANCTKWYCLLRKENAQLRAENARMKAVVDAGRQAIEDAHVEQLHNDGEECCGLCDLKNALKALDDAEKREG